MKKKTAHETETLSPSGIPLSVHKSQNCRGCVQNSVSESFSHHLHKRLRGAPGSSGLDKQRGLKPTNGTLLLKLHTQKKSV